MSVDDSIRRRMALGLKATLVSRTLYVLASAGLTVALTRYLLTPQGYGNLTFALAVLGALQLFAGAGLAKSGARYVTEYLETAPGQVPYVIRNTFLAIAVLVTAVGATLLQFHEAIATLLGTVALAPLLAVGAGYLVLYPFAISTRQLFNAFNRVTWSAVFRSIEAVCRLLFAVGFVLAGFGAAGALMGYVTGYAVAAVSAAGAFYYWFYRDLERDSSRQSGLRRRLLAYSVPLSLTSAADVLDYRVDGILVGILLNPVAVGFYTLAKDVAEFTVVPARAIDTTIAPRMGERKASGNAENAARIYETALKHVLLLYVPAGVGLAIVAEPAIRYVFGTDFLGAVPVLQVFAGFIVVNAVNTMTANSLDYLGRGRERAFVNGGTSISNFGLNLLLIPAVGVVGAAIATVLTHSVYALGNVYYLYREVPFRVGRVLAETAVILVISVGMAVVVWLTLPHATNLPGLVGVIGLGVGVWAGLSVLSGLLDPDLLREVVA